MKRGGLTLIEILVVASILVLVLGPVWRVFQSGTKTSLRGMMQVETTNEARRVLCQVHNDLKQACFYLRPSGLRIGFDLILTTIQGTEGLPQYSFFSFPTVGSVSMTVPTTGGNDSAERRASEITYRLEKGDSPAEPFLRLIREERFQEPLARNFPPTGIRKTILSHKVNFFEIRRYPVTSGNKSQFFFWVNLQLVDSYQAKGLTPNPGHSLQARQSGVAIADFFDVVSPEFFSSIWNQEGMRRNWHTLLKPPLAQTP